MARVLVVDDDPAIREMVALAVEKIGHRAERAGSVEEARRALAAEGCDLVVCDIYMPGEGGMELLAEVRRRQPDLPVILMTARGSVETAAAAAREGVFEYLAKPFDLQVLLERVAAALRPAPVPSPDAAAGPGTMIVGSHPAIVEVYKAVARVAPLGVPVLITGESGSGKELVARALHRFGRTPDGPFVAVPCGAIPDTLLESELFGHVRGAFTDARRDHVGALGRAAGGTVFLDEIGDVSPAFQVKMLRFLQDRVVQPVGAEEARVVDVRVVAATHRNLRALVAAGQFREDLYFRLAGYEIALPPLRHRLADLPLLVEHLRMRLSVELETGEVAPAAPAVLERLAAHSWPGNVRELEQVVRRCLIDGRTLADPSLVARVIEGLSGTQAGAAATRPGTLAEAERAHILAVLEATGGNRSAAARLLGIERKTLSRKLRSFGINLASAPGGRLPP